MLAVKSINPKTKESILESIRLDVAHLINSFRRNPFDFLSEYALQAELYTQMRLHTDSKLSVEPNGIFSESLKEIPISLVNGEYSKWLDLACIHPDPDVSRAYIEWLVATEKMTRKDCSMNAALWGLPLLCAIELKYRQNLGNTWIGGSVRDAKKCVNYRAQPYHASRHGLAPEHLKLWYPKFQNDFRYLSICFIQMESDYNQQVEAAERKDRCNLIRKSDGPVNRIEFDHIILVSPGEMTTWTFPEDHLPEH